MRSKLHICYTPVGDLGLSHACTPVGGSVSASPCRPSLVNSAGSLVGVLDPSGSAPSSIRFLWLCLMFGCASETYSYQIFLHGIFSAPRPLIELQATGKDGVPYFTAQPAEAEVMKASLLLIPLSP